MSLTLMLRNCDQLPNGAPTQVVLERRGAIVGRSPTVDWCLPDPSNVISSRHCEISYREGQYLLSDTSTNGTLVNGRPATGSHALVNGDLITIGQYEVTVALAGSPPPGSFSQQTAPSTSSGWDSHIPAGPVGVDPMSWDRPKPMPAISGMGSMSHNLAPAAAMSPPAPVSAWAATPTTEPQPAPALHSNWGQTEPAPSASASGWSSPAGQSAGPAAADDIWGKLAESNVVDWARGGFGQPQTAPARDPLNLAASQPEAFLDPLPATPPAAPTMAEAGPNPTPPQVVSGELGLALVLSAAGLQREQISVPEQAALTTAGVVLRGLIAGLVVMLEARARAKAQLGAQSTSLEFDGNNPLKFARTPEQALAQLLNPAERGFMSTDRAIEDAFFDLQSHQMATLKAMQGALKATLDRFSPASIKSRTEAGGLLAQIVPGARDATLWRAYEKEFGGVAQGSDEAFMDVFAKEFRNAYEDQSAQRIKR